MKWLTNLFKPVEQPVKVVAKSKPAPKTEVLDYSELYTIALGNARYLNALIKTKTAHLVYLGKRELKKREHEIEGIKTKLAEEEFYAEYYNAKRIRQKGSSQHATV